MHLEQEKEKEMNAKIKELIIVQVRTVMRAWRQRSTVTHSNKHNKDYSLTLSYYY